MVYRNSSDIGRSSEKMRKRPEFISLRTSKMRLVFITSQKMINDCSNSTMQDIISFKYRLLTDPVDLNTSYFTSIVKQYTHNNIFIST